MFKLITSEVQPLTMGLAQEFHALTPSPTERTLLPTRVQHLRHKAEAGRLVTFHWAKARLGQEWFRMNGQHSAAMLCDLNGAFPDGLFVHLDTYSVDDTNDLAVLFRQFDDRKSGRSAADVAGAYQGLEAELADVAKPTAKLGIEAVNWYRQNIVGVAAPAGDEQYSLFHASALHRFLRWVNEVFSIKTPELRRVPIVAAMYGTFDKNEEEARKFWVDVARGGKEFDDLAPSTVLDAWLKTAKEERKQELRPGDYYRGCIYAWNAFREDKTISSVRYDKRKTGQEISD